MRSGISLGRVLGVKITLHPSWFLIFALIVFSLANPRIGGFGALSTGARWTMAVVVALLFFTSVVVHELAHALVARRRGMHVDEITLFIFGGAAKLEQESPNARTEAVVAGVGPLASLLVGGLFMGLWLLMRDSTSELVQVVAGAAAGLGSANLLLAGFNIIPGFPMDGGRLLRALVWGITHDFVRATRIATLVGRGFAYLLIGFGVFIALSDDVIRGIWLAFIGWFLNQAAEASYKRVAVEKLVEGIRVGDVMDREVPTINPNLTLDTLVEQHLLSGQATLYPVTLDDRLMGTIEIGQVSRVPRADWPTTRVTDVMTRGDRLEMVSVVQPLWDAVTRFEESGSQAIPVVDLDDGRRLLGLITRDGVFRALRARAQLRA